MKSPMIQKADYIKEAEKSGYSELQVLQSAAGYYIGTMYKDPVDGFEEPGSRDSVYFETREEAEEYLAYVESTGDTSGLRTRP